MESLALAVTIILAGVASITLVSVLLAWRPRRSLPGRILAGVVGAITGFCGAWLASLGASVFVEMLGVLVCAAGVGALIRQVSKDTPTS